MGNYFPFIVALPRMFPMEPAHFQNAAVATDDKRCSEMGEKYLFLFVLDDSETINLRFDDAMLCRSFTNPKS